MTKKNKSNKNMQNIKNEKMQNTMRLFKLNNKGLSPLFATVILIGFALILGSLILKLGGNLQTTAKAIGECRNFNILQIDAKTTSPKVCFGQYGELNTNYKTQKVSSLDIKYDNNNNYLIQVNG